MININKKPKLFILGDSFFVDIEKSYPLEDIFIVHNFASQSSSEFRIYQNYLRLCNKKRIKKDDPNIRVLIGHTSATRLYAPAKERDITGIDMVKKFYNDDCIDFYMDIIDTTFWEFTYLNICRELDSICHYKTVHFHWYNNTPIYNFKTGTNIHITETEKNFNLYENKDFKNHMSPPTINKLFPMLLRGLV
tara:strand:- start:159 stop:734 length:576 start_codon:yes stop_codon:yes gene_type:complete